MKGIMFTEDLFPKVVDRSKLQTRRTGGLDYVNGHLENEEHTDLCGVPEFQEMETNPEVISTKGNDDSITWKGLYPSFFIPGTEYEYYFLKPRYQLNEIVYLKEPYIIYYKNMSWPPNGAIVSVDQYIGFKYLNKNLDKSIDYKWKNKMFMPAKYARHFVKITDIRCERLYDISEEDAKAEGVEKGRLLGFGRIGMKSYKEGFFIKWIEINGMKSFDLNPFVYPYTFCLTDKPDKL